MKRDQLERAVLEVVGGKQTMKAAAQMYDVPFTTLQTYFHRARVMLVKELGVYSSCA
jgi:DNA-directed RNA polymerase specialized sigma24 family protein